jgi:hypothetical protein
MPAHVVAGHLVIVSAPIAVLIALVYALRPPARTALRVPLLVSVAANLALAIWAAVAGSQLHQALQASRPDAGHAAELALAHLHAKAGDALTVASLVLAAVAAVLAWRRLSPHRTASGRGHAVAAAVLVLSALAVAWFTVDTIGLALEAVWSPGSTAVARS